ncbi:MAG: Kae1-associated kinase Bud32, partial [Desulfurococcales archaeon]|nr:Kae1-associated kinase Bud32 [Desulfurococcales archaeon]
MDGLRVKLLMALGAEAALYEASFLGLEAVIKVRRRKDYRAEALDRVLRVRRTSLEAKILRDLRTAGLHVPALFYVDTEEGVLVMERVEGKLLRDLIAEGAEVCRALREVGREVGVMHNKGIIHGDLTTSNMVLSGSTPYIIDFGLAKYSNRLEDVATDIHLFIRSVEATHFGVKEELIKCFMEGYSQVIQYPSEEVMSKV